MQIGKCSLKLLTQNMVAEFYVKILTEKFNEMRSISGKNWELQFDNDLKHKIVSSGIFEINIK